MGVKRCADGTLNPSAKKFKPEPPKPDPAAVKAAAERAEAKAALEAKIAAAEEEAARMKTSPGPPRRRRRENKPPRASGCGKELERKEAALEKAARARGKPS